MKGFDLMGSTDGIKWKKITLKTVGNYDFIRYIPKKEKK